MVIKIIPDVINKNSQPSFGVKIHKPVSTLKKAASWLVWNGNLEESKTAITKLAALSNKKDGIKVRFDDEMTLHTFIVKQKSKGTEYILLTPLINTLSKNLDKTADFLTDVISLEKKFKNGFSEHKEWNNYSFTVIEPHEKISLLEDISFNIKRTCINVKDKVRKEFLFAIAKRENIGEYKVRYLKAPNSAFSYHVSIKNKNNPLTKKYTRVLVNVFIDDKQDISTYLHSSKFQSDIERGLYQEQRNLDKKIQKDKETHELIKHIEKEFSRK